MPVFILVIKHFILTSFSKKNNRHGFSFVGGNYIAELSAVQCIHVNNGIIRYNQYHCFCVCSKADESWHRPTVCSTEPENRKK